MSADATNVARFSTEVDRFGIVLVVDSQSDAVIPAGPANEVGPENAAEILDDLNAGGDPNDPDKQYFGVSRAYIDSMDSVEGYRITAPVPLADYRFWATSVEAQQDVERYRAMEALFGGLSDD